MSTSLYELSVGSYLQVVEAAGNFLQKGADFCSEKDIDPAGVVTTSLYADMAPFHFQAVCIAHHSMGAVKGLQSGEFGPPTGYPQMDYAGLQNLVSDTLSDLKALDREAIDGLSGGKVVFKMGETQIPFSVENFVLSFSLPNLYFHATTAYDILRMQGVPLSKLDFLGPMKIG